MKRSEAFAYRHKIETAAVLQSDEQALESIDLFPNWKPDIDVHAGERYKYDNRLWKVLIDHKTQADWAPNIAVSLFIEVSLDEWPEWKQPVGATDAYNVGDKVSHNNKHWVSIIDGNVWEPGAVGTESLWEEK